jgi:hypothetical protein
MVIAQRFHKYVHTHKYKKENKLNAPLQLCLNKSAYMNRKIQ